MIAFMPELDGLWWFLSALPRYCRERLPIERSRESGICPSPDH